MSATSGKPLLGAKVLIAEDDAILAFDMMCFLRSAGAETVGPAPNLKRALALSEDGSLSCGVLDVSLRGELIFPAAQRLRERCAGIVFYTGYADIGGLKRAWPEAQILIKPAPSKFLIAAVSTACCSVGRPVTAH
ncbi:MAG: hypothetical protein WCD20_14550 [Rhodomicrobium sp.]